MGVLDEDSECMGEVNDEVDDGEGVSAVVTMSEKGL